MSDDPAGPPALRFAASRPPLFPLVHGSTPRNGPRAEWERRRPRTRNIFSREGKKNVARTHSLTVSILPSCIRVRLATLRYLDFKERGSQRRRQMAQPMPGARGRLETAFTVCRAAALVTHLPPQLSLKEEDHHCPWPRRNEAISPSVGPHRRRSVRFPRDEDREALQREAERGLVTTPARNYPCRADESSACGPRSR